MKKDYTTPELRIFTVAPAKCLLASGENLNNQTYAGDTTGFWD